jgi:type 1 glutamine amidotransferase
MRFLLPLVFLLSAFGVATAAEPTTKRVLLLAQSPDGHPPGTHEYMAGIKIFARCLEKTPNLKVEIVKADDPWTEGPELLKEADGVVLFLSEGARWMQADPRRYEAFARLAERGGGFVAVHWALGTKDAKNIDGFVKLLGGRHGGPDRKYQVLPAAELEVADAKHPIAAGLDKVKIREELYYKLKFAKSEPGVKPIITSLIDGERETVGWAWERPDKGRSFGYSGGHFHENFAREEYRRLICQGILWSVRLPVPEKGLAVEVSKEALELGAAP